MIGDILKDLRKSKGLTIAESAKIFGVATRTYSSYEAGEREPNISLINQFADYYGVTADYLLGREQKPEPYYHEGLEDGLKEIYQKLPRDVRANILQAMLDAVLSYQQMQELPDQETMQEICRTVLLKYYADAVSAGTGEPLTDDPAGEIEVLETPEALTANCVIRVNGESMEPTYSDGDLVLVKFQETVELGQIGVFTVNGEGYIKELGRNCLISHNDKYPDIPLRDTDNVRCTGRVVGVGKTVK